MHPILASRRRLLLYLLGWIPAVALLSLLLWGASGLSWLGAAGVLAPACLVYAFLCLSPWYICRALPLRVSSAANLALTFGAASATAGLVLAGAARLGAGLLKQPAVPWGVPFAMGVLIYLVSVGLHYAGLAVEAAREADRRASEARALAREAELQALRMQLNPHFLFNSLNSIGALATIDGLRARDMCARLGDFLRTSLHLGARENIPLREELALARNYLEVEQVRFGDRLRVETEIEPVCEECRLPALLLQPLVENAVKHGIAGLLEGGAIRLTARQHGDEIAITIENGFDPESSANRSLGLGLKHARRRLQMRYGGKATVEAGPIDNLYRVVLRLPCEPSMASRNRA